MRECIVIQLYSKLLLHPITVYTVFSRLRIVF